MAINVVKRVIVAKRLSGFKSCHQDMAISPRNNVKAVPGMVPKAVAKTKSLFFTGAKPYSHCMGVAVKHIIRRMSSVENPLSSVRAK